MDEPAWQAATPVTDFRQLDPNEGQPVSERTEARILVDDDAVYVGMRLYDKDPNGIQPQLARRDDPIDGDLVEVTFDSYHDHLSAVIFRLSAGGARRDATVSSNGNQDNSWDAVWDGATTIDSLGWTAEFRIPLSQLRYNRNVSQQAGFPIWLKNRARARSRTSFVYAKDAAAGNQSLRTSDRPRPVAPVICVSEKPDGKAARKSSLLMVPTP